MTRTHRSLAAVSMMAIILSACATQPDPEPEVIQVQQPEEPVYVQPDPEPEVIEREPAPTILLAPGQPVPGSIEDFAYQTGGDPRVYFAYDQYTLSPAARETLRKQADWLKAYNGYSALIEGHADERGTRQYNIALGARRANSVKAFLVSQGVSPARLTTVSYGKERPIDARSNEDGWARNRNGYTNLRPLGQS